jgi:hypothetical protein
MCYYKFYSLRENVLDTKNVSVGTYLIVTWVRNCGQTFSCINIYLVENLYYKADFVVKRNTMLAIYYNLGNKLGRVG